MDVFSTIPIWVHVVLFYILCFTLPYFVAFFIAKIREKQVRKMRARREQEISDGIAVKRLVQKRQIEEVLRGDFVSVKEFNDAWTMPSFSLVSETKSKNGFLVDANVYEKKTKYGSGLKYEDEPGCYVILVFEKPVANKDYSNYRDVYVGQSVKMYQRVRNHFSGKGNGDVYADIKYGKYVYVRFFPCGEEVLNTKEKELIALFDATNSYNKTSGGSAMR